MLRQLTLSAANLRKRSILGDNDLYVTMYDVNENYAFCFDIVCAPGDSDIVDGQTYTLTDMLADYSYGQNLLTSNYINFASVSFVRNAGAYTVNITDEDSVNYLLTYTPPTVITQFVDSVSITMDNGRKNTVTDYTSSQGVFQLIGYDMTRTYNMYLALYSNQIAGTYTIDDIYSQYTSIYVNQNKVEVNTIRGSFTVVGDADTCSTYIEILGEDSVLYRITFEYPGYVPTIIPVDTVDIVLDDSTKNFLNKEPAFFQIWGENGSYAFEAVIMSEDIAGVYTDKDLYPDFTKLYVYSATDTTQINPLEFRSIVVVGDTSFFNAHFEMIGMDTILYRINFIYPGAVAPTDTVVLSFTNNIVNFVFDETATTGSFTLVGGADQNGEYGLVLMVNSNQFAGTYTQASVAALGLVHATATDTVDIMYSEIRNFTVIGDANDCSTHIEMVGSDGIFYRITFAYQGYTPPTAVENTEIQFVVYSEENTIVINGAEGETMAIYDMTGKMIANTKATSTVERVNVGVAGVYVVRIGEQALKVVVK